MYRMTQMCNNLFCIAQQRNQLQFLSQKGKHSTNSDHMSLLYMDIWFILRGGGSQLKDKWRALILIFLRPSLMAEQCVVPAIIHPPGDKYHQFLPSTSLLILILMLFITYNL